MSEPSLPALPTPAQLEAHLQEVMGRETARLREAISKLLYSEAGKKKCTLHLDGFQGADINAMVQELCAAGYRPQIEEEIEKDCQIYRKITITW